MAQWQDCRPECWEACGPEFNPRPGREGFDSSLNWGNNRKLLFIPFIVCRPLKGRDYFEEFHVHFMSSFMLSVSSAYSTKLSFLYV